MFRALILAALLVFGQKPDAGKTQPIGVVAGIVVAPQGTAVKQPFQVILLSQEYANLWTADVQQREDNYWERYKPTLAQKKELFFELSRQAYLDTFQFIENKMKSDLGANYTKFSRNSSADGKFDFRNLPLGEYKVLAEGKVGTQSPSVWSEWIKLTDSTPQFVQLKKLP